MRNALLGCILTLSFGCGLLEDAVSDELEKEADPTLVEIQLGNQPEPLPLTFSLNSTTTSATLAGGPQTHLWGQLLSLHVEDIADGGDGVIEVDSSTAVFTGAPMIFTITVDSADGLNADYEVLTGVVSPDSCEFGINPSTDASTVFGDKLMTCLEDWADANGAPNQLELLLSAADGVKQAGLSGTAESNDTDITARHDIESDTVIKKIKISGTLIDNAEHVSVTKAGIDVTAHWSYLNDPMCSTTTRRCSCQLGSLQLDIKGKLRILAGVDESDLTATGYTAQLGHGDFAIDTDAKFVYKNGSITTNDFSGTPTFAGPNGTTLNATDWIKGVIKTGIELGSGGQNLYAKVTYRAESNTCQREGWYRAKGLFTGSLAD